jgi:hypothetical protein
MRALNINAISENINLNCPFFSVTGKKRQNDLSRGERRLSRGERRSGGERYAREEGDMMDT